MPPSLLSFGALTGPLLFGNFCGSTFFRVSLGTVPRLVTLDANLISSSAILRFCKVVSSIRRSISLLRSRSVKVKLDSDENV
jgi:hypothetical protein